jgi:myo-inositol 2-dehydrogenase / D-chiro-inositol 1-dehydrogenase
MKSDNDSANITRRQFLKTSSAAVAGAALAASPVQPAHAAQTKPLQIALIGCGGRGTGAARDCLEAAKYLKLDVRLTMMADLFQDRMDRSRKALRDLSVEVPSSRCLLGFDAYKKVMESDVDIVLLTTPPNFRPVHLPAAIVAGKHVFVEKPIAVDPPGCRAIVQAGKLAEQKRLSIVAGTQRRHEVGYLAVAKAVQDGAIGQILGGTIHFCLGGGGMGRKPENVSASEWMIRTWNGWCELSGDHIVEQHVHSIDVMHWFLGTHPIQCVSFGHRARRTGGNMYDFFSTDYEFPGGVHIHSMARQVTGCWDRIGQSFRGEKGIADITGLVAADRVYVGPADRKAKLTLPKVDGHENSYVNEHANLLRSVVEQNPLNEAQQIADSTLSAIMGRISAYTGQLVTWDEMVASNFSCKPSAADFEHGTVELPKEEPTLPPGKLV